MLKTTKKFGFIIKTLMWKKYLMWIIFNQFNFFIFVDNNFPQVFHIKDVENLFPSIISIKSSLFNVENLKL